MSMESGVRRVHDNYVNTVRDSIKLDSSRKIHYGGSSLKQGMSKLRGKGGARNIMQISGKIQKKFQGAAKKALSAKNQAKQGIRKNKKIKF